MQMSKVEFAQWVGFILGTSGTFVALQALGLESYWPRLIGSVIVGGGMGWLFSNQMKQLEMRGGD